MRENRQTAIGLVFGHEGGYVNAKTDAGGPTKFGITAKTLGAWRKLGRSATAGEVRALKIEEAEAILVAGYLKPVGFDDLPSGLDYAAFDYGVNSGPTQAIKSLQRVLQTDAAGKPLAFDGFIGPKTINAVKARCAVPGGVQALIRDYIDERMKFLRGLGGSQGFKANGRGWTRRVTGIDPKGLIKSEPGVIGHALAMANSDLVAVNKALTTSAAVGFLGSMEIPLEIVEQAAALAPPQATKLSSTSQGLALITALLGLLVTVIGGLTTALEPLAGTYPWAQSALSFLAAVGPIVTAVGLAWNAIAEKTRLLSGAPV